MKSKIEARILADSIDKYGNRITTFYLVFPRFILAELSTHRVFSMNSASSRAIPFKKMKEMVINDPFIPIAWQKDHKGMQGVEYITDNKKLKLLTSLWLRARDKAVEHATYINDAGATKQLCNRLLEPFMWHKVLLTATEFENFFNLRCPQYYDGKQTHKSKIEYCKANNSDASEYGKEYWQAVNKGQAEIHIMDLAEKIYDAMNESTPIELKAGEWHMPYGDNIDLDNIESLEVLESTLLKVCTARCARLSYQTVGDNPKIDYKADINLHDRLLEMKHLSPFEHVALCKEDKRYANFKGWQSYRNALGY